MQVVKEQGMALLVRRHAGQSINSDRACLAGFGLDSWAGGPGQGRAATASAYAEPVRTAASSSTSS
ncbi:hypothetical protein Vqi01_20600 [Micromonospora qiuiae]|uniref:Uncharacterized protein n=1 Tax=Micromonospora qiuiae TaxID=502268 RepID=A0ABQ4J9Z8_9ACTN|nr:hypothetical protein Vqi01_20600 [Micromonospora qiuiae]